MIRRPPRSTPLYSSAASDVYKRQDHTYTEISRYTKGSGIYRFMYESNHLIPGVESVSDLSYLPDKANNFFGFNGYESVYNKDWMDDKLPSALDGGPYRTR